MKREDRTMQTKLALANALKKRMEHKPLSKISVRELVEDCDLNRKTFYYHFDDIYDLLKWLLEQETVEVVRNLDLLLDLEDAVRFVMQYITENKHILNCALESVGRDRLKGFFIDDFHAIAQTNIRMAADAMGADVPPGFVQFLVTLYTEAVAGILISWVEDWHKDTPSSITPEYAALFLRASLPAALAEVSRERERP